MSTTNDKGAKKSTFDPDDFRIELMKKENHVQYMEFFKTHFLSREPISRALHADVNECTDRFGEVFLSCMYTGTSVCAIHVPRNELAGMMLCKVLTRDDRTTFSENFEDKSQSFKYLMRALSHLENSVDIFENPKVTKVWEIGATTVAPKFAGNRIVYRLAEESERRAVELGCQAGTSQSTNVITQHVRKKLGFEECYCIDLATFELDGKKVFDMSIIDNGTIVAKVLRKYLVDDVKN